MPCATAPWDGTWRGSSWRPARCEPTATSPSAGWRPLGTHPNGLGNASACTISIATRFRRWTADSERRSLYVLDVRSPGEYVAGHLPGSRSAPGGQLVQETDHFVPTLRSRIVLVDDTGVRATMTASWLNQMGWPEVAVLDGALEG